MKIDLQLNLACAVVTLYMYIFKNAFLKATNYRFHHGNEDEARVFIEQSYHELLYKLVHERLIPENGFEFDILSSTLVACRADRKVLIFELAINNFNTIPQKDRAVFCFTESESEGLEIKVLTDPTLVDALKDKKDE